MPYASVVQEYPQMYPLKKICRYFELSLKNNLLWRWILTFADGGIRISRILIIVRRPMAPKSHLRRLLSRITECSSDRHSASVTMLLRQGCGFLRGFLSLHLVGWRARFLKLSYFLEHGERRRKSIALDIMDAMVITAAQTQQGRPEETARWLRTQ